MLFLMKKVTFPIHPHHLNWRRVVDLHHKHASNMLQLISSECQYACLVYSPKSGGRTGIRTLTSRILDLRFSRSLPLVLTRLTLPLCLELHWGFEPQALNWKSSMLPINTSEALEQVLRTELRPPGW